MIMVHINLPGCTWGRWIQFDDHIFQMGGEKTNQLEKISENRRPHEKRRELGERHDGCRGFWRILSVKMPGACDLSASFSTVRWGNLAPKWNRIKHERVVWFPMESMYGIFTYIWMIFMVNAGKHTIHGSSGFGFGLAMYLLWSDGLVPWWEFM